ncbi:MAG: GNAT family N-acetyltransferase [Solobacterium sp.]|nr:GNAT family N-acetyltransferase [Solobacterium sp.]
MIRRLKNAESFRDLICTVQSSPAYSDPALVRESRPEEGPQRSASKRNHQMFGVYSGEEKTGLFVFLIVPEEKYIEMLYGLSAEKSAWTEMLGFLKENRPGYQADFVFNPAHDLLKGELEARGAEFDTEQMRMIYTHHHAAVNTDGIRVLDDEYLEDYLAMHSKDVYWTGERIIKAPERFCTYIAVDDGNLAGYIDVTHCFDENEPYDLLVKPEYRGRGYGRKLLAYALYMNEPHDMVLLVNIDNAAAISLYESLGFVHAEDQNSLTAHWQIPE